LGLVGIINDDMKILRLFSLLFLALVVLSACNKSDDNDNNSTKKSKWVFNFAGQSVQPGDTIRVIHQSSNYSITWNDENGITIPDGHNTFIQICSGAVTYQRYTNNSLIFNAGPSLCKFVFEDYGNLQNRFDTIYIQIEPIDLIGKIDITGTTDGYYENNKYIQGPFLEFYLNEDLRRMFMTEKEIGINSVSGVPIMADVPKDYFKITSFGNERETCYPSSKDWGWFTEFKWVNNTSQTSNGETFYGKINSAYADYWFFKFNYGDYSHEIRKYKDSKECLWDGEWNH